MFNNLMVVDQQNSENKMNPSSNHFHDKSPPSGKLRKNDNSYFEKSPGYVSFGE